MGGDLRQGVGECRAEATATAEGRGERLERQSSRQGQIPDRQFQGGSTGWLAGDVRGEQLHLGTRWCCLFYSCIEPIFIECLLSVRS